MPDDAKNGQPEDLSLKSVLRATKSDFWEEAIVKLGYADQFGIELDRPFEFVVRLHGPGEAERVISMVGQYNEFDGEAVGALVGQLMDQGVLMYAEFGRLGSPDLRLYVREPEENREGVRDLLARLRPDRLEDWGPYGLHAWWD